MARSPGSLMLHCLRMAEPMQFPNIDPVALAIGPIVIRWYALAYVAGILLGHGYVSWLNRRRPVPLLGQAARDDLNLYAVLGIILGGRLGYVLFYNLEYYLSNPADMAAVWHGGMSFHGGLIGALVAFAIFARRHTVSWMALMDMIAAATPIGLFFGRLANFVNGELYGRVTTHAVGMVFPTGGPMARHPSQLYEAALEGFALFVILWVVVARTRALNYRGLVGGLFLAGYVMARFGIEFFREPDVQLGTFAFDLSMGQLLCLPMIVLGMWLVFTAKSRQIMSS